MGSVYEVVRTATDQWCALKMMHPHPFQSEEMRDRFKAPGPYHRAAPE